MYRVVIFLIVIQVVSATNGFVMPLRNDGHNLEELTPPAMEPGQFCVFFVCLNDPTRDHFKCFTGERPKGVGKQITIRRCPVTKDDLMRPPTIIEPRK